MIERNQLRKHYRTVFKFIEQERSMRSRVLSEPRRSKAIAEADNAQEAIEAPGLAVGAHLEAEPQPQQASFLGGDRGNY